MRTQVSWEFPQTGNRAELHTTLETRQFSCTSSHFSLLSLLRPHHVCFTLQISCYSWTLTACSSAYMPVFISMYVPPSPNLSHFQGPEILALSCVFSLKFQEKQLDYHSIQVRSPTAMAKQGGAMWKHAHRCVPLICEAVLRGAGARRQNCKHTTLSTPHYHPMVSRADTVQVRVSMQVSVMFLGRILP